MERLQRTVNTHIIILKASINMPQPASLIVFEINNLSSTPEQQYETRDMDTDSTLKLLETSNDIGLHNWSKKLVVPGRHQ